MSKPVERDTVVGRIADILKRSAVADAGQLIRLLERNLPKRLFDVAELDYVAAHAWESRLRDVLSRSAVCGCFYCLARFPPSDIQDWVNDDALCPRCGIDSVIGSASGYPITGVFLEEMRRHWF